jgi:hypothetical protein
MNETRSADAKAAAGAAPAPPHSSAASVAAARARALLATAQNPAFEAYPNLCWTAGPFKPEYQPWTFDPPHYCDICNCLPQYCSSYALHFSRDPACEAQVNAILEGKNAFRNAADVKAGRTPDKVFVGTNQLEDPEAKRQCFQLGWDVALAQAPARELTLARIDIAREERDLKRVEAKMASIKEKLERAVLDNNAALAAVALGQSKLAANTEKLQRSVLARDAAIEVIALGFRRRKAACVIQCFVRFHAKVDRFFDKLNEKSRMAQQK